MAWIPRPGEYTCAVCSKSGIYTHLLAGKEYCVSCLHKHAAKLLAEINRLKEGDFTPEEMHNLCHNKKSVSPKEFCDGCEAYQQQLFGRSPITELRAENDKLRAQLEMFIGGGSHLARE